MYGEFTLRETLMYFGWIAGMSTEEVDEKIDFLIRMLQLPNVTRFVKTLSGGQQRRMSLAAALLHGMQVFQHSIVDIFVCRFAWSAFYSIILSVVCYYFVKCFHLQTL